MGNNRKWVQIAILFVILVIGGFTIVTGLNREGTVPQIGDRAPDFKVAGLDGKNHKLSDWKEKPVILNFWATYCEPCRNEMPALQKQMEKWGASGLSVIGMNVGENQVTVRSFTEQYDIRFPIYLDQDDAIRKEYGVLNYPTTFFLKPDGSIYRIQVGEMTEAFIDKTVAGMLGR